MADSESESDMERSTKEDKVGVTVLAKRPTSLRCLELLPFRFFFVLLSLLVAFFAAEVEKGVAVVVVVMSEVEPPDRLSGRESWRRGRVDWVFLFLFTLMWSCQYVPRWGSF